MSSRLWVVFVTALVWLWSMPAAFAQWPEPRLRAKASDSQVEVGEPFTVELTALALQGAPGPTDPEINPPSSLSARGPQIGQRMEMQFGTGSSGTWAGISATWQVTGSRPGKFVIPAPTVRWSGKLLRANSIPIEVVAKGTLQRGPSSPFLFPGGPGFPGLPGFRFPPFDADDEIEDSDLPTTEGLSLTDAPDPFVFLRAVADKQSAVVGEQITISFYRYRRTDVLAELNQPRQASLADFLRVPLLQNPGADSALYAMAGERKYEVRVIDRAAIFPVRAGNLHTGKLSARVTGRRIGSQALRESNDIVIHVTEPPLAGRPPGYMIGDVGNFGLSAIVQPRRIQQGGSVSVNLKITGNGNFPQSLKVPERTGVEWLDPEKRESIEPRNGIVGGFRSFGYVVRIKESGRVNLGKVEFSFWDPGQKRYQVVSTELGGVDVTAVASARSGSHGASEDAAAAAKADPFAALPGSRKVLGEYRPPPSLSWLDGTRIWWFLAAPPLLAFATSAGARAVRLVGARRAREKTSPARLSADALREAKAARERGEIKEMASALERALYHAIEGATALRARGVLLDELPAELTRRGISAELAGHLQDMLAACDSVRFDPTAGSAAAQALEGRAQDLVGELGRLKAT